MVLLCQMAEKVLRLPPDDFVSTLQISACQIFELAIQNCHGTGDHLVEGILEVTLARFDHPFSGLALPTVLYNTVCSTRLIIAALLT